MAFQKLGKNALLLGTCVPCLKKNTSKIRVARLELDENIHMYFKKNEYFFAHDPGKTCKTGDVVLIQALAQRLSTLVTHEVKDVVYPLGDITDPITGKKVVVGQYREDMEKQNMVFGEEDSAFKYDNAPQRGWQEDRKDFTHQDSYRKYHEFDDRDQPYAV